MKNKTSIHIEMISGVAGDMLVAALLNIFSDYESTAKWLCSALKKYIPVTPKEEIILNIKETKPGGIKALKVNFETPEDSWFISNEDKHNHISEQPSTHSHHQHFSTIKEIIDTSTLSDWVKSKSLRTFKILAKAEGEVHDIPFDKVHFHEVGSLDAIYEVCSFFLLAEKLNVTNFISNQLIIGTGTVKCAHGLMPVPVPAVLNMIKNYNLPFKKINWETGELSTPTGLAILVGADCKFLERETENSENLSNFGRVEKIGYGAGHKKITGLVNCLRITTYQQEDFSEISPINENIIEIKTNIDDLNGEEINFLIDQLFKIGALDVLQYQVIMKKGRHGIVLEILVYEYDFNHIVQFIFKQSTTIGIRFKKIDRLILRRDEKIITARGFDFKIKFVIEPDIMNSTNKHDLKKRFKIEDSSLREGLDFINKDKSHTITRKEIVAELTDLVNKKYLS